MVPAMEELGWTRARARDSPLGLDGLLNASSQYLSNASSLHRCLVAGRENGYCPLAAAVIIFTIAAALTVSFARVQGSKAVSLAPLSEDPIEITSVSSMLPQPDQTIVIQGRGFGLHTPYRNADSPYLAIRDKTAQWAAGRMVPQNWDEVTLDVKSWADTQIIVSGFSGAYGSGHWKLSPADQIEIAVWNPQSGRGPATYQLTVAHTPEN